MSARPTPEYGSDGFADDDTIEMVFTPEQMQVLSAAAQAGASATSGGSASATATAVNASRRWPLAQSAAILGVAVALMGLSSAVHRAVVQQQTPPELQTVPLPRTAPVASAIAVQTAISLTPVAAESVAREVASEPAAARPAAAPSSDPVRLRNPFDRSEVFEFPPGTSRQEARQALAEMLLARAHERRASAHR